MITVVEQWCSEFVTEAVLVKIVVSMVNGGELGLWSDAMGIFRKALWWFRDVVALWFKYGEGLRRAAV